MSGLHFGGKRAAAMKKRLRELKERHDAGLDPFTGELRTKMPEAPTTKGDE